MKSVYTQFGLAALGAIMVFSAGCAAPVHKVDSAVFYERLNYRLYDDIDRGD